MSVFDGFGADAWAQYHKQLVSSVIGSEFDGKIAQPLAMAQRVEWDSLSPERNFWFKQDISNTIPSWGPLYKRTTAVLSDAYKSFLGTLASKIVESSPLSGRDKLCKLERRHRELQKQIDLLTSEANKEWQIYLSQTPPELLKPRSHWEEELGYAAHLRNKQNEIQGIEGTILLVAIQAGGDLQEIGCALSALGAPNAQIPLPFSTETVGLGNDYWQNYHATTLDGDIFNFRAESSPRTFTIEEGRPKTQLFECRWDTSVDTGWCSLFDLNGSITDQANAESLKRSMSRITVNFDNLGLFNIIRPGWFKEELIRRHADKVDPDIFSSGGELPLVPKQIVLAHGLNLEIEVSGDCRDYLYRRFQQNVGGFSIGPFSFGTDGATTTYVETRVTKTENGLRIEDTSNRPFVVAVVSERPYDWLAQKPTPLWVQLANEFGGIDRAIDAVEYIHNQVAGDSNLRRISAGVL